jgi:hypothetical protein
MGLRSLAADRPIGVVLGELVTREVTRHRSRRVRRREALEENWRRVEAELPLLPVEPLP